MVQHVLDQVSKLELTKIVTVVGHGAEQVKSDSEIVVSMLCKVNN
jgi:bifunctional UDP-N-acetylglucosamine pyrophosphorylase/glucosamine-1-phosphate N-acetyltransferase